MLWFSCINDDDTKDFLKMHARNANNDAAI